DQKCVIDNHEVEILHGPLTEGEPSYAENCCQQMRPASIGSLSSAEMCSAKLVERNRTVSMSSRPGPEWSSETLSVLLSPRLLGFLPEYASILGAVAGAHFVRAVAPAYGIPVIVHSDHCAKKLLPWFDGMLEADEAFFKQHGEPLFSSHMLDLSEEPDEENIAICAKYLTRMAPMKQILEMEIGITGGVEDGVDNSGAAKEKLYSTPADVFAVYKALNPISPMFTIAAAFGNVHGVYKAGNVVLKPELLEEMQVYAREQIKSTTGQDIERPLNFVFHGGSGSEKHHITTALNAGVVKMNVDTDTQWAYWEGLLKFYKAKEGYLQGQIGNPEGEDKPNKSFYDPRKWIRECENSMVKRVKESCADLANTN
ncbi:FBA1, partial [Symbiodinium necroappetens]